LLQVVEAKTEKELDEIQKLFEEYASSLKISLDFQDFDHELANLPGAYSSPDGCLLLAFWQGQVAGCVGLKKFSPGICEMKRLYTKAQFRGLGIGKMLCVTVIEKARSIGYQRMRLDTLPSMERARSLYTNLGFEEIEPYRYNPVDGASFMELKLL
jgi:ribosomal protein S18 acetylase RimI-like enzyme